MLYGNLYYFCSTLNNKVNGFLAQLVEQRTENPCVPGSIPGETTANHCEAPILGAFFIALLRLLKYMLKLPRKVPVGLTLFDMLFIFSDQVIMISQK